MAVKKKQPKAVQTAKLSTPDLNITFAMVGDNKNPVIKIQVETSEFAKGLSISPATWMEINKILFNPTDSKTLTDG